MTITLDLQPEIERGLLERAQAKGISLAGFAQEVLAREAGVAPPAKGPASDARNFYELFTPVRGLLTDEEVDRFFSRTPSSSRPIEFE